MAEKRRGDIAWNGAPSGTVSARDERSLHAAHASAERYDVIVDFSRYRLRASVVLENRVGVDPGNPYDPAKTAEVMRFDVAEDAIDGSLVPTDLPSTHPAEDPSE